MRHAILKVRSFFEGAGIAILLLAAYIRALLSPSHLAVYHNPLSISTVAGGLAIDFVVASLIFAVALVLLDRYCPEQKGLLWAALLGLVVAGAVDFVVFLLNCCRMNVAWCTRFKEVLPMAALPAALCVGYFFPIALRNSIRAARFGLAIIGCSILWMLPGLVFTAVRTHRPSANAFNRAVQVPLPRRAESSGFCWTSFRMTRCMSIGRQT